MAQVFISYSRKDKEFVRKLADALAAQKREAWADWKDIPLTAEWQQEIFTNIEAADNFVFVISPESSASANCRREIDHAVANNKRMVPILHRLVPDEAIPEALGKIQRIDFGENDNFDSKFAALIAAIDTDLPWTQIHTRLLTRAKEWEREAKDSSFLLRGKDLREAEQWMAGSGEREPKPTTLHSQYILASRKAATRLQQIIVGAVTVAFLVAVGLAIYAFRQKNVAEQRLRLAATRHLIGNSREMLHVQPDTALLLAAEAVAASHPLAESEQRAARDVLWDAMANTRSVEYFLHGLDRDIISLGVDNTGRSLYAADVSGIVRWDLTSRSLAGPKLIGPKGILFSFWDVAPSPDGKTFYVAIAGTGVLALDAESGKLLKAFNLGESEAVAPFSVRSIAVSADGRWLAVGTCLAQGPTTFACGSATILVIDLRTQSVAKKISLANQTHIVKVAFRPGLTEIAAALEDGNVAVVDYSSGHLAYKQAAKCQSGPEARVLAFSPDGQLLAIACSDKNIFLWVPGAVTVRVINSGASPTALVFDRSGSSVAVGTEDGSIQIVDTKSGLTERRLRSLRGKINALTFGPNRLLFSATSSGEISAWNLAVKDEFSTDLPLQTAPVSAAAVDNLHNIVAAATLWGEVVVWQLDGGNVRETHLASSGAGSRDKGSVAISPNGEKVAVGDCNRVEDLLCKQGRIRIWNLREERRGPLTVLGHSGNVAAMLFLNENRLVSGGSDGSLLTWDLGNTSAPVLQAHVGDQGVLVIVRGSQGKMLIVGSYDGQISFWNVSNLTEERSRLKMDKPILAIAVATQSPRFAVSENGRTTLWDLNGNEYRATTLASVGGRVLYLSPDGTEVFGESGPGKVAFWHSDSPRPYREFLLDATMSAGVYSPARKQIVTWGDSVVIWNLDEDAWAPAVSRKANRAFRAEEVERYLDLERKPKQ